MIAEIGHGLLWLAAGCAALQAVAGLLPRTRIAGLTVTAAALQGWLWLWIGGCLGWSFAITDLSVVGVAATTAAPTPAGLKLLAVVVQDGGWLIAATALAAAAGTAIAFVDPRRAVLGALGLLGSILSAALLLHVEPFARLVPAPTEGAGFPVAVRARLAGIGGGASGPAMAVGETRDGVTLAAVTPLAGPDSTGVAAEVRAGGTVLVPEWRETFEPPAAFPVTAHAIDRGGLVTARLTPADAGRWRVGVTRVGWAWLALPVGLVGAAVRLRPRRRR